MTIPGRLILDGALTLFLIVSGAVFVVAAGTLPPPRFDPLGAGAFPTALGWLMIVLGTADLMLLAWRSRSARSNEFHEAIPLDGLARAGAVMLFTTLYAMSMAVFQVRFAVATALYLAATTMIMGRTGLVRTLLLFTVFVLLAVVLEFLLKTVVYLDLP